ncbi:ABC-type uncharacterized transport system substrate-binding protein [Thiogranum longum]|uniref:ABC-type uncharacterized transport system substrate-binding protein n=1 Tax=Thiogranum longum TaxID=1537524 RepID=A0A4R1HFG7_9GAMM|nr:ABC transporter substrate binding protein [Thiogranum longum]TCK18960.1 ABC-type uncharacterized transport system substrate-binding protein [Thiogranum longum]
MSKQYRKTGMLEYVHSIPMAILLVTTLTLIVFFMAPDSVQAKETVNILFVSSQNTSPYLRFVEEAELELRKGDSLSVNTTTLSANQLGNDKFTNTALTYDLIVSLGKKAAEAVLKLKPETPVLYTLIPEVTYNSLKQSGNLACPDRQCSAVYIDQPLNRLLHIVAVAFDGQRELGVLLGPLSVKQSDMLDQLAKKTRFTLHTELARNQQEILPALNSILKQSGLLLSIPDPVVYNRKTAKSILLTTYRHRVPVIAYSRAYAEAGATLSVFSTPKQIAVQTVSVIQDFFDSDTNALQPPQHPKRYSIKVNRHVAESLGLDFDANPTFQSLLKEADDEES